MTVKRLSKWEVLIKTGGYTNTNQMPVHKVIILERSEVKGC